MNLPFKPLILRVWNQTKALRRPLWQELHHQRVHAVQIALGDTLAALREEIRASRPFTETAHDSQLLSNTLLRELMRIERRLERLEMRLLEAENGPQTKPGKGARPTARKAATLKSLRGTA